MIGYICTNCGHSISVQDQYEGKRIKCPKCDSVGVVFDDSGRIKITCKNCGNENNVPNTLAGKEIQCPKCSSLVSVPSEEKEPVEDIDNNTPKQKPESPEDSVISESSLIFIISLIAVVIVAGLIIMAAVIPSYKSRKAREAQNIRRQQKVNDSRQTDQNVKSSDEKPLSLRDALKWNKGATIVCVIAIPCLILLFCWVYWCPECHKMWAMKKISPFINFGDFKEYQCKHCGHIRRIR